MSTAVLVSSCDKYSFAWDGFVHGFKKYWSDCPWPIYFMSNNLSAPIGTGLYYPDTFNWGQMMLLSVNHLLKAGYDIILFMCEDYWLTAPTDTHSIRKFASYMIVGALDSIKLNPSQDASVSLNYFHYVLPINRFKPDALYRTSMQAGLWYVPTLMRLIRPEDSIHQFETEGGTRALESDVFCAVKEFKWLHYIHPDDDTFNPRWAPGAVEQGKFTPSAHLYAQQEGIML